MLGRPFDQQRIATLERGLARDFPRYPTPEAVAIGWSKRADGSAEGTVILATTSDNDAAVVAAVVEKRLAIGPNEQVDLRCGSLEATGLSTRNKLVLLTLEASSPVMFWMLERETLPERVATTQLGTDPNCVVASVYIAGAMPSSLNPLAS